MPLPRGILNNNPGNIRKSPAQWQGEVTGTDPNFCTFSAAKYGLRAIMLLLRRYYYVSDLTTIQQVISRWAPSSENNTSAYISAVAAQMKVQPGDMLLMCPETYVSFAQAIALHENGRPPLNYQPYWYDNATYQAAYSLSVPDAQTIPT